MTPPYTAHRPLRSHKAEEGSGTVTTIGLLLMIIIIGLTCVGVASGYAARARVQAVADMVALAGGRSSALNPWVSQGSLPCDDARQVAARNGLSVEHCAVVGADVYVVVGGTAQILGVPITVGARARAGPADVRVPS